MLGGLVALTALALQTAAPALADPAVATPAPRVAVHARAVTSGTAAVSVRVTITVSGAGIGNVRFVGHAFPSAPVDPSSVELDGVTVPSGTVTVEPARITVRLGAGADAANGGVLTPGRHLLAYVQTRPTGRGADAGVSGTLEYTVGHQQYVLDAGPVPVTDPDLTLRIPPNTGERVPARIGTGRTVEYSALLTDRGGSAAAVDLRLTLPRGLRLDTGFGVLRIDFDPAGAGAGRPIPCLHPGARRVTCRVGPVAHGAVVGLVIPVRAMRDAPPGATSAMTVAAVPVGTADQDPTDNLLHPRVRFTGVAVLRFALTADRHRVRVGQAVRVTLTVRNDGPQAAPNTLGLVLLISRSLRLVRFLPARRGPGRSWTRTTLGPGTAVEWTLGTLPAHRTAVATAVLRARSAGRGDVGFFGGSDAGYPGCDGGRGRCDDNAGAVLHVTR